MAALPRHAPSAWQFFLAGRLQWNGRVNKDNKGISIPVQVYPMATGTVTVKILGPEPDSPNPAFYYPVVYDEGREGIDAMFLGGDWHESEGNVIPEMQNIKML